MGARPSKDSQKQSSPLRRNKSIKNIKDIVKAVKVVQEKIKNETIESEEYDRLQSELVTYAEKVTKIKKQNEETRELRRNILSTIQQLVTKKNENTGKTTASSPKEGSQLRGKTTTVNKQTARKSLTEMEPKVKNLTDDIAVIENSNDKSRLSYLTKVTGNLTSELQMIDVTDDSFCIKRKSVLDTTLEQCNQRIQKQNFDRIKEVENSLKEAENKHFNYKTEFGNISGTSSKNTYEKYLQYLNQLRAKVKKVPDIQEMKQRKEYLLFNIDNNMLAIEQKVKEMLNRSEVRGLEELLQILRKLDICDLQPIIPLLNQIRQNVEVHLKQYEEHVRRNQTGIKRVSQETQQNCAQIQNITSTFVIKETPDLRNQNQSENVRRHQNNQKLQRGSYITRPNSSEEEQIVAGRLESIRQGLENITPAIMTFIGTKTSPNFRNLDESLVKLVIKLDEIKLKATNKLYLLKNELRKEIGSYGDILNERIDQTEKLEKAENEIRTILNKIGKSSFFNDHEYTSLEKQIHTKKQLLSDLQTVPELDARKETCMINLDMCMRKLLNTRGKEEQTQNYFSKQQKQDTEFTYPQRKPVEMAREKNFSQSIKPVVSSPRNKVVNREKTQYVQITDNYNQNQEAIQRQKIDNKDDIKDAKVARNVNTNPHNLKSRMYTTTVVQRRLDGNSAKNKPTYRKSTDDILADIMAAKNEIEDLGNKVQNHTYAIQNYEILKERLQEYQLYLTRFQMSPNCVDLQNFKNEVFQDTEKYLQQLHSINETNKENSFKEKINTEEILADIMAAKNKIEDLGNRIENRTFAKQNCEIFKEKLQDYQRYITSLKISPNLQNLKTEILQLIEKYLQQLKTIKETNEENKIKEKTTDGIDRSIQDLISDNIMAAKNEIEDVGTKIQNPIYAIENYETLEERLQEYQDYLNKLQTSPHRNSLQNSKTEVLQIIEKYLQQLRTVKQTNEEMNLLENNLNRRLAEQKITIQKAKANDQLVRGHKQISTLPGSPKLFSNGTRNQYQATSQEVPKPTERWKNNSGPKNVAASVTQPHLYPQKVEEHGMEGSHKSNESGSINREYKQINSKSITDEIFKDITSVSENVKDLGKKITNHIDAVENYNSIKDKLEEHQRRLNGFQIADPNILAYRNKILGNIQQYLQELKEIKQRDEETIMAGKFASIQGDLENIQNQVAIFTGTRSSSWFQQLYNLLANLKSNLEQLNPIRSSNLYKLKAEFTKRVNNCEDILKQRAHQHEEIETLEHEIQQLLARIASYSSSLDNSGPRSLNEQIHTLKNKLSGLQVIPELVTRKDTCIKNLESCTSDLASKSSKKDESNLVTKQTMKIEKNKEKSDNILKVPKPIKTQEHSGKSVDRYQKHKKDENKTTFQLLSASVTQINNQDVEKTFSIIPTRVDKFQYQTTSQDHQKLAKIEYEVQQILDKINSCRISISASDYHSLVEQINMHKNELGKLQVAPEMVTRHEIILKNLDTCFTKLNYKKPKEESLQILDVHQYFRDDFDLNSVDGLDDLEKIKRIYEYAKLFETAVENFKEEQYSLEYFVLDEKLMRSLEKLDKIKCRDNQTVTTEKVKAIEYVKDLHKQLDRKSSETENTESKAAEKHDIKIIKRENKEKLIESTDLRKQSSLATIITNTDKKINKKPTEDLQIFDAHQYFRDDFDLNSVDKLDDLEKIKGIFEYAKSFEYFVRSFNEEKYSLEYFILDEKLMRSLEMLDKIKCRDNQTVTTEKVKAIEYVKDLHKRLDQNVKQSSETENVESKSAERHLKHDIKIMKGENKKKATESTDLTKQSNLPTIITNTFNKINKKPTEELQIFDAHQYFRDDFDLNSVDKLDDLEKIKKIVEYAKSFENSVRSFNEEKYSLEYFVLDEKLMRSLEKLDKIKCRDNQTVTNEKVKAIEYIKNLHERLDKNAKNDAEDQSTTPEETGSNRENLEKKSHGIVETML